MKKNKNTKSNNKLAIIAIIISVLQLLFTSPLLIDYFFAGKLTVSKFKTDKFEKVVNHTFVIRNEGNKVVTNIEIEIQKLEGSKILLIGETKGIKIDEPKPLYKLSNNIKSEKVFLTIARLVSKDYIAVTIQQPIKLYNSFNNITKKVSFPRINNAISDQGNALR